MRESRGWAADGKTRKTIEKATALDENQSIESNSDQNQWKAVLRKDISG